MAKRKRGSIRTVGDVKEGQLASGRRIIIPKSKEFAPGLFDSMAKSIVSPEIKAQMRERARRRKNK